MKNTPAAGSHQSSNHLRSHENAQQSNEAEQKKSRHKKILISICTLFLAALFGGAIYCESESEPTLKGFEPLRAIPAKACDDSDNCETNVILLKGQIVGDSISLLNEIKELVDKDYSYLCVDSPGGDNVAAEKLGREISRLGLNTCVAKKYVSLVSGEEYSSPICNSACPWLLLSGKNRLALTEHADIGFHASLGQIRFCQRTVYTYEAAREQKMYATLITDYGARHSVKPEYIAKHIELLKKSFSVGSGTLQDVSVNELYTRFAFFTEVRAK